MPNATATRTKGSWISALGLADQYLAPHHLLTRWMYRLTRDRQAQRLLILDLL